jgi:alpha-L-rhamnosidase
VAAWHECRHGRIEASGVLDGATVTYTVTLPQGCTGCLTHNPDHKATTVAGQPVTIPATGLTLPSGTHSITFRV